MELKYREIGENSLIQESERIYEFLQGKNLSERIDISPCFKEVDFPTITLTGIYAAAVYL